jgi:hypothetical protein
MAIAYFRLLTVLPLRPLLSDPSLRRRMALATFLEAPLLYLRAMFEALYACERMAPAPVPA